MMEDAVLEESTNGRQWPRQPKTVEGLGIPEAFVQDLVLRRALVDGRTSTIQLSAALAIGPLLMSSLIEELRELRYLEVQGLDGRDYRVALTELGREQANQRMNLNRYVGSAPVSLEAYCDMVRAQAAKPNITRRSMRSAFEDLVISDELIDELGPAARSAGALFLYGPPGTGKSSIAERLNRIHDDAVLVPRAVEVDSQIVTVYDPIVHQAIEAQPPELDPRWVLCHRPSIIVGGELTGDMLDLKLETNSGIYLAPLQMQANNGIFVIDDFGRQSLTPEQLLNRWIVPLDRQIDYLSLSYGVKFEIPFDAKIVFSTNLDPSSLGDEAFFRRIENKILIPTIGDEQFDEVLRRVAVHFGVWVAPGAAPYLRHVSRTFGDGDLRPYLPKSVCRILQSICEYDEAPLLLDMDSIDRVARMYFTHAAAMRGGDPASSGATSTAHPGRPAEFDQYVEASLEFRAALEGAGNAGGVGGAEAATCPDGDDNADSLDAFDQLVQGMELEDSSLSGTEIGRDGELAFASSSGDQGQSDECFF